MTTRWKLPLVLTIALTLGACTTDDAGDTEEPDAGANEEEGSAETGFDRDAQAADARELLGTPEDEIEEDGDTRITRRGDEEYPATMDLRPGRRNLELDDDGSGTYVVTRVIVETPDGENLVVE